MSAIVSVCFDRHLPVQCDPNRIAVLPFDVVIVGTGAAGASCAMAAARHGLRVAVLSKGPRTSSNTAWARGGIAAVLADNDSFDRHIQDTLRCGAGLCDESVVEHIVHGGPAAINALIALGAGFDREPSGALALGLEGGHSRHRIVHAHGDATGVAVQAALDHGLQATPGITCFDDAYAIDVLREPGQGPVRGLLCVDHGGTTLLLDAPNVVLATGGSGQIWRETTNPVQATGDGLAIGLRAGAVARDLEFVQFHPTCLYIAGAARILISEIVRGAGAVLRDRDGLAFMDGLHPDADLAPRDIVSRAIADRMRETGDTNVYLDLAGVDGDPTKLFPGIAEACGRFGLNIATDAIPVRPGAHYMVGGLLASCSGQTSVPGLHAIGECASTGLHGANRMASNSLLEGLVTGSTCGTQLEPAGSTRGLSTHLIQASTASPAMAINQTDMLYALKSLMWRAVGVHRSGEGLSDAATQLDFWMDVAQRLGGSDRSGRELRNMLLVARVVTACASHRVESRGSHFRVDYPGQHQASEHVLLTPCSSTEDTIDALAIESMPLDAQVEV